MSCSCQSEKNLEKQALIFKALGHPTRLKMVYALAQKECCVCELHEIAGDSLPTISRHLSVLKQAEIVKTQKIGLHIYYSLAMPCISSLLACSLDKIKK